MTTHLFKRLEQFRKKNKLSVLALCKQMDMLHTVNYYRWKKVQRITGAYKKIIENFLDQKETPKSEIKDLLSITSDIAVIGIACHYPGASNIKELWENILARRVQFRRMLDKRLPLSEYHDDDPKALDKTYLTKAAFLENFQFDWGKLRIPKKTFESTDIVHWLALDVALKTFEDAGYRLGEIPIENTGVIVGNTLTGEQARSQMLRLRWPYMQKVLRVTLGHLGKSLQEGAQIISETEKIFKSPFNPMTEDSLAGGLANTIAGRICNYMNLKGGGYIVDGACSSSLLAVVTAADALTMGHMDLALAGGVDVSLDPFELVGFARAGALAKDQMRVYDQAANGFLPGEGCGFVLLKRLADAIKDKNYVYAVIKGWGISSDGRGGIMEPSSNGQSLAIGRAYKDLPYKISDVDFVEGHGTGTTKGDRVELEGIALSINATIKKENENKRSCGVTSFKSIVGHTKAAAGVGGLIKAVLAVNQRILPPTANCTHPNDVFNAKAKNMYPIIQGGRLPLDRPVRAGISSAGFGGINCHITIESKDEPKKEIKTKIDDRALRVSPQTTEVFVFSSRTVIHLEKVIQKFKEDLRNISIAEMADLAAFLNKKVKNRLPIKAAIVTDSPEHLYEALVAIEQEIKSFQLEKDKVYRVKAADPVTNIVISNGIKKCRIGYLYSGQGAQRLNMTRTIVERYPWARELYKLSDLPLIERVYVPTEKFSSKEEQQEFEKKLTDTKITQPAIILSSLIWTEFFSKLGIEPQVCIGHGLGELTAFYKAGAFTKGILVKFAQFRGELMASNGHVSGSMVSLFCSKQKAESLIKDILGNIIIANINSPNQVVVSGGRKEIEKVKELAVKEKISAYQLNVSNAFHSSFMKEASEKIKQTKILPDTFRSGDIKVYSCMTGAAINSGLNLREYFSKQVISPVNFVAAIKVASKEYDLLVELGPGKILSDLVKAINTEVPCFPVEGFPENDRDLNIVLAQMFIRNVPVKFDELYRNRLIKIFVPASRKKFIENQCERPLRLGSQVMKVEPSRISSPAVKILESKEEIIPGGLPAVEGEDNIAELLFNLTHEVTGYEKSSLSLNLKLSDNLNLDSIKAAELLGKAARALGVAGKIDPSKFSNNTLGQIRDRLHVLVQEHGKAGGGIESTLDILSRYHDKGWVRNFTQHLVPQQITTRNVNQLIGLKNVVFVSEQGEDCLVEAINEDLKGLKVQTTKMTYHEPKVQMHNVNCLIAILPKGLKYRELSKDSLMEIIDRFHKIISLGDAHHFEKDAFIVFVQFGGAAFGENDCLLDVASASAKSLASTLFLEVPTLKVRILDFDRGIADKDISQKVLDELQTYEKFEAVSYDSHLRREVVRYENSQPQNYKKRNLSWSTKDVVLVTGGAKGITAQCALEFAHMTKAHMVLVGRSPVPESKKEGTNEISQTLRQFEKEDLKASYFQCDVTDEKEVSLLIEKIHAKYGKITGFIHGAGLNSLKHLGQMTVNEALNESLPKVMGAVNVCKALSQDPPKMIVAITSIIGLTGMQGSGWYGLANEILNLYLHQFKAQNPKTQVVSIAYSIWDEVGMGTRLGSVEILSNRGVQAIAVVQGVKRFRQMIEYAPGVQQVIVAARFAGLDTWKSQTSRPNNFRFLERVEYFLPGLEVIARADLNVNDDPYLLDHNWKGTLLFPFVFGLEAMAEVVAYVLGIDKFDHLKVKNIDLEKPISVPQDTGTTIEIHAEVLEKQNSRSPQEVKVEIYSKQTGYESPHFSAVFEIGADPIDLEKRKSGVRGKAKDAIDLDVQVDIYGPVLFQGKLFQCLEKIDGLSYDEKSQNGECLFMSKFGESTNDFFKIAKKYNGHLLIGDPFFVDSLLQSMQLMIPQDISLPRDIEQIEFALQEGAKSPILGRSTIKRLDPDYYRGDVAASQGQFFFRIKNCRLKVLDTITTNPTVNDLADPAVRDQRILQQKLSDLSNALGFTPPVLRCSHNSPEKVYNRELRHQIVVPLLQEAVESLTENSKRRCRNIKIKWLKSGRPTIQGNNLGNIGVSVSHHKGFFLVVAGYGSQGCDVEEIQARNPEKWLEVLGNEKYGLLKEMGGNESDFSKNCTMIWSAAEALWKATNRSQVLRLTVHNEDYAIFESDDIEDKKLIVCFPIRLTMGGERIFSFVYAGSTKDRESKKLNLVTQLGYDNTIFNMGVSRGPEGQIVYAKRFPVIFKNTQNNSKSVYFSNYFNWMGEIREFSLFPIGGELTRLFETGQWGMATNHVKLQILGSLKTNDVVEGRLWAYRISGEKDSVVDLRFDWFKVLPGGKLERIANAEQRISWVKIIGHGVAKSEYFPENIRAFFDSIRPTKVVSNDAQSFLPYPSNLGLGTKLSEYDRGMVLLCQQTFNTDFEESNLVGNIYFSNYGKWLGKTQALYFYQFSKQVFNQEFFCIDCEIYHMAEAMPFDEIKVLMYLTRVYEKGVELYFEFFKDHVRLAYAKHTIIWGWLDKNKFISEKIPVDLLKLISSGESGR